MTIAIITLIIIQSFVLSLLFKGLRMHRTRIADLEAQAYKLAGQCERLQIEWNILDSDGRVDVQELQETVNTHTNQIAVLNGVVIAQAVVQLGTVMLVADSNK